MIKDGLAERFPNFVANSLARKLPNGFFHFLAKVVIALLAARETDNGDSRRQLAVGGEVIKRRQEFAVGEIAGRSKNHDAARLRHGASG